MTQTHQPAKVTGGTRYLLDVLEDPSGVPSWKWNIDSTPLDQNGNLAGLATPVAGGEAPTREKAVQAAAKWINESTKP